MGRRRTTEHAVTVSEHDDEPVVILSRRAAKQAAKAEKQRGKAAKADRALAEKQGRIADAEAGTPAVPVTGTTVKRYIGIARVVVPVAAPLVYQAVGAARSRWDDHRARRLGVAPDELSAFSGRGTALYARTHNLANSVRELASRRPDDDAVAAFATDAGGRISDLEAAVRSAEQMPAARRRRAHVAVSSELDRLETRMLDLWGLDRPGPGAAGLPAAGR